MGCKATKIADHKRAKRVRFGDNRKRTESSDEQWDGTRFLKTVNVYQTATAAIQELDDRELEAALGMLEAQLEQVAEQARFAQEDMKDISDELNQAKIDLSALINLPDEKKVNFGLSDQPFSEIVHESEELVALLEAEIEPQRDKLTKENENLAKIEADKSSVLQQIQLRNDYEATVENTLLQMFGGVYSSTNEEESQTALGHYKMRHESLLSVAFNWKKITSSFESTYRILQSTKHFIKKKNSDRKLKLKRSGERIQKYGKALLSNLQLVSKIIQMPCPFNEDDGKTLLAIGNQFMGEKLEVKSASIYLLLKTLQSKLKQSIRWCHSIYEDIIDRDCESSSDHYNTMKRMMADQRRDLVSRTMKRLTGKELDGYEADFNAFTDLPPRIDPIENIKFLSRISSAYTNSTI